jgi:hypothetical protein
MTRKELSTHPKELAGKPGKGIFSLSGTNFLAVDTAIFDLSIPIFAKFLYITLILHASTKKPPTTQTLGHYMGCSQRQIFRALTILENNGLIKRIQQYDKNGGRQPSLYELFDVPRLRKESTQSRKKGKDASDGKP